MIPLTSQFLLRIFDFPQFTCILRKWEVFYSQCEASSFLDLGYCSIGDCSRGGKFLNIGYLHFTLPRECPFSGGRELETVPKIGVFRFRIYGSV